MGCSLPKVIDWAIRMPILLPRRQRNQHLRCTFCGVLPNDDVQCNSDESHRLPVRSQLMSLLRQGCVLTHFRRPAHSLAPKGTTDNTGC